MLLGSRSTNMTTTWAAFCNMWRPQVQHVFPTACANLLPLLDAPQLPPLPDLATILINDLAALGAACILVLDDYQLIAEATIHQLLTRLLDHLPQSGGCQRQSQRIRCDDDLWGA